MNRLLRKMFSNAKVQRQLLVTFLLTISLPLLAVGLFLLIITNRNLTAHYIEQVNSDNLRVRSIMLDATMNLYNASESLATDSSLRNLLYRDFETVSERTRTLDNFSLLSNLMSKNASISTLLVYSPNESIGDYSYFRTITEEVRATEWYQQAASSATPFWMVQPREDDFSNQSWELTLFFRIPLIRSKDFAVLVMGLSDNYLRNLVENNTFSTFISANRETLFYSTERQKKGTAMPLSLDYDVPYYQESGVMTLTDYSTAIGSVSTLRPYLSDDRLYIFTQDKDALETIRSTTLTYSLLVLTAFLVPCILFFLFSRYFSARVVTLRNAMHQAGNGDYNIIDHFHGNDELSEAFGDLQQMIGKIKENEAQVYRAQITEQKLLNQQQQMEFKMLASQINPHFLYNTLETIRMKAFTAGNRDVAKAIKLLGKSLRYVLENTGTASTTLDKELAYIETYLAIQKLRFGDRVNYVLDAQPGLDLSRYQILPLLLQPIVENAFSHGLEGKEKDGEIRITIRKDEFPYLSITISDNGIGMSLEEQAVLQRNIQIKDETKTRSIGLYNINQRIKLCYGTGHGMIINSTPGRGTSVVLKLPLNKIQ